MLDGKLIEIAPGIDVERDVLDRMDFKPLIAANLKTMDARLFKPAPMGLRAMIEARPARARSPHLDLLDAYPVAAQ